MHNIFSLSYFIFMLHCGLVTITNWHREKEREREKRCEQIDLLNDLHNQSTSWRKVYSAQQSEVLHYTAVPQIGWKRKPLLVLWVNFHPQGMPKKSTMWNVWLKFHPQCTQWKSWVNFHPQCTLWKCYYVRIIGDFFFPTHCVHSVSDPLVKQGWIFTHSVQEESFIVMYSEG